MRSDSPTMPTSRARRMSSGSEAHGSAAFWSATKSSSVLGRTIELAVRSRATGSSPSNDSSSNTASQR